MTTTAENITFLLICSFFADDSKMYAEITDIADATRLQAAMDSMVQGLRHGS